MEPVGEVVEFDGVVRELEGRGERPDAGGRRGLAVVDDLFEQVGRLVGEDLQPDVGQGEGVAAGLVEGEAEGALLEPAINGALTDLGSFRSLRNGAAFQQIFDGFLLGPGE